MKLLTTILIIFLVTQTTEKTVQQVLEEQGCMTYPTYGLSIQLIQQMNRMKPNLMSDLRTLSGVNITAPVPFIQTVTINDLQSAINDRKQMMVIDSALRTLPQQVLLYNWYLLGLCGIPLAAKPGTSNHESGLAIDIYEAESWQQSLEQFNFQYHGVSDPVHYDYMGGGENLSEYSVQAFQMLWNCNNPTDQISVSGIYDSMTQSRVMKSPAEGFQKFCDDKIIQ